MNVVNLRVYSDPELVPVIVVVDPQREYQAGGRALNLPEAAAAIENCRRVLAFAREHGFPIAVTRWRQRGKFLADASRFGAWLEGLEPHGSDMVFEKSMPSCYSNPAFAEMMAAGGGDNAVLLGFTGALACLSTTIDAYHRRHKLTFLADASASHVIGGCRASDTDRIVSSIIALYARTSTVGKWMRAQREALGN